MDDARASSSDRIVRDILRGLYEGRFVAGQRLVEPDLVSRYGVSRSTVREAIKRLAAQGVVEAQHNRGARIRQLTRADALNVLRITEVVVGLAARLAAERIAAGADPAPVREALAQVIEASAGEDRLAFARARTRFHRALARTGANPELDALLSNLQVHLVRNRLVMDPRERGQSYGRIGDAVLAGDAEGAEGAARAHVRRMVALIDRAWEPPVVTPPPEP